MTPNLGIRYPVDTDVIDASYFANFASDVNQALLELQQAIDEHTQAPAAWATLDTTTPALAVGIDTNINMDAEVADTDGMFTPGTQIMTANTPGIYRVTTWDWTLNNPAGWNTFQVAIQKNNVAQPIGAARKRLTASSSPPSTGLSLLIPMLVGDFVGPRLFYTGGAGPTTVIDGSFSAVLVTRF